MKSNLIYFLSFADKRYNSSKRIKKEAIESGFFDKVIVGNESMFDNWYLDKYKDRFKERGFGYYQWKPYIIHNLLMRMNEGDILVYADSGCIINPSGGEIFKEYVKLLTDSTTGILLVRQGTIEKDWTKGDVFDYFNFYDDNKIINKPQIASGFIMLRKTKESAMLIYEWLYICHECHYLVDDSKSIIPSFESFIENRHDQSVLSLLSVKYEHIEIDDSNFYTADGDYDKMKVFPIWFARRRGRKMTIKQKIKKFLRKII